MYKKETTPTSAVVLQLVVDSECWWNLSTKNHYWLYCYFMDKFIAGSLIKTIAYINT